MSFSVGEVVGDYLVLAVLGKGGMGEVYQVRHVITERVEAVKVLLPGLTNDSESADRFLREIKVLAALDHPNIARLYTAEWSGAQLLMIMEFVEGETLASKLRECGMPLEGSLGYVIQALSALEYAHTRGVIHRDVKPANVMITPTDDVKLMDFGIARATWSPALTRAGSTVGSLHYMSPEQIRGEDLDGRSDLYSMGVILYEIATGRRPFEGKNDYSILTAHLRETPAPPTSWNAQVPTWLNETIMKSLAKTRDQRFQTAGELRTTIELNLQSAAPVSDGQPEYGNTLGTKVSHPNRASPFPAHQLRYMLSGVLVTVAALIVTATQIPRWSRARASQASDHRGSTSLRLYSSPARVPQAVLPQGSSQLPLLSTLEPSEAPSADHVVTEQPPQDSQHAQQDSATPGGPHSWHQKTHRVTDGSASVGAGSDASNGAPNAEKPDDRRESREPTSSLDLEPRLRGLEARAAAMRDFWGTVQKQNRGDFGLSVRPDITAALRLVDSALRDARTHLVHGDDVAAKQSMGEAEHTIEDLERESGK